MMKSNSQEESPMSNPSKKFSAPLMITSNYCSVCKEQKQHFSSIKIVTRDQAKDYDNDIGGEQHTVGICTDCFESTEEYKDARKAMEIAQKAIDDASLKLILNGKAGKYVTSVDGYQQISYSDLTSDFKETLHPEFASHWEQFELETDYLNPRREDLLKQNILH
jgi:hypothetical protein